MTTLLQISDAHFGTEQPPVVQALLQLARDQAPDLVVMSGDITQRARRSQFRAARAFIDQLKPAALLAIPGNHDIPLFNLALRAFAPYSDLRSEKELERFPRAALERLRALDRALLFEKLGRWLNGRQIDTMLKRRDKILAIAERLVAEQGEEKVLY